MRERFSVDAKQLFSELFKRELSNYTDYGVVKMMTDPDSDSALHLPYAVLAVNGGRMSSKGPGAWSWIITVSVVAEDEEAASDIADFIYETIHQLHGARGIVDGVGWVSGVDDLSIPDRTGVSTSPAGDLVQYTGSWTTLVRK